jgi:hypothetical protein
VPRRVPLLLAALLAAVLVAPAAAAADPVDRAAAALRAGDGVYVDPGYDGQAAQPSGDELHALRKAIGDAGGGIYLALMPSSALEARGGDADGLLSDIYAATRRAGTYGLVVDGSVRAGSQGDLPRGEAGALMRSAFLAHRDDGAGPMLQDFVSEVARARASADTPAGDPSGGGSGVPTGAVIGLVALAAGGAWLFASRRSRARPSSPRPPAELAEVRRVAEEDLTALAEDITALDIQSDLPGADPRAVEDYRAAGERYVEARSALERTRSVEEMEPVTRLIEDGRQLMASARARFEGREPPPRRPLCFFDPRHGPSVRDVEWQPEGGAAREVPACAACALRVEEGVEPHAREVVAGGRSVPYYQAGWLGPWAAGYWGPVGFGGGGFFTGLLLGEALGGGLYAPVAWGADWDSGDQGDRGDGDFGDSGDFGGGDFGGGDFGGGDFGG